MIEDVFAALDHMNTLTRKGMRLREASKITAERTGVSYAKIEALHVISIRDASLLPRIRSGEITLHHAQLECGARKRRDNDIRLGVIYGKKDRFYEATTPLQRYLRAWEKKSFAFTHVNPAEARRRLKTIGELRESLEAVCVDLRTREARPKTRHGQ